MPIFAARVDHLTTAKNVFVTAVSFAMSIDGPPSSPPFGQELLKISAQGQVEYMLAEDEDTPLITADEHVRSVVQTGLNKTFSSFETELYSFISDDSDVDVASQSTTEENILKHLYDLEWVCNKIIHKMGLLKDFVSKWVEISSNVTRAIEGKKFDSIIMWGLKVKLIELNCKVLEAVGYGNVILPSPARVILLKTWLPFIRKVKPLVDLKNREEENFPYKMDEELCQNIEGAIMSLILALPSNDQADILADWIKAEEVVRFPDLSEAFEVWCYRSKSAKRRLMEDVDRD